MQDGRRTRRSNGVERAEEERDPTRAGRREPPGSRVRRSEVARSLRGSSKRYTRWLLSTTFFTSYGSLQFYSPTFLHPLSDDSFLIGLIVQDELKWQSVVVRKFWDKLLCFFWDSLNSQEFVKLYIDVILFILIFIVKQHKFRDTYKPYFLIHLFKYIYTLYLVISYLIKRDFPQSNSIS